MTISEIITTLAIIIIIVTITVGVSKSEEKITPEHVVVCHGTEYTVKLPMWLLRHGDLQDFSDYAEGFCFNK